MLLAYRCVFSYNNVNICVGYTHVISYIYDCTMAGPCDRVESFILYNLHELKRYSYIVIKNNLMIKQTYVKR